MKRLSFITVLLTVGAVSAAAQEKVFGELGLSYGEVELGDIGESLENFQMHGAGAFVSPAGLGVQIGGSYSNLTIDGFGDLEAYALDGHIYGDFGGSKIGAFAGNTRIGEVEVFGLGGLDLDTDILSYGLEGQRRAGAFTYHGYAGLADFVDIDEIETKIYGFGLNFDVSRSLQLSADFDGMNLSADGVEEGLRMSTAALGMNYYLAAHEAPVRLSAVVGRTAAEYGGDDESGLMFGVGAAFLFGGELSAGREKLFDTFHLPF